MKKILSVSIVAVVLTSACKKENSIQASMDVELLEADLLYRTVFTDGPYGRTMGIAKIYRNETGDQLVLDSFNVSNGPDLHVYLARQQQPVNFIDLGKLKATSGRQVYKINGTVNFGDYKYALIHCQQYDHLFGSSILQ